MSEVTDLLTDLVRLPSVNPCGCEPEGPYQGEERMTRFVHEWLQGRGIDCRRQSVSPGRENVIARVPGREEPPIVFESHMDTVGVDGMTVAPFQPRIEEGRMFGRGSCDTKSSLAAMMIALARVAQGDPPPRTIELVAVVDEEYLHGGVARYLEDSGPVHCAVVGEPTRLRVVVAHNGALRTRITTRGVSAHSSNPDNGVNAIYRMARAVLSLEQLAESLRERAPHPLVGRPTLSVGTIVGGMAVNIVPELCQIMVDRRLIPGETPDGAFDEIAEALDGILEPGDDLAHTLKDWPVETDRNAGIVETVREAVRAIGGEDEPEGAPYCTDGCDFAERGVPLVVFGPGDIAQAHTAGEWVEVAQVEAAVDAY
ncbi:MAG TPA: acetylornithine deacetylase, partial [Armatimonadetes bacterium]|nr:acetylornithine deacetylase [Armatimonadota bacterium]